MQPDGNRFWGRGRITAYSEVAPKWGYYRGMAWIAEGKLNYREDPKLKDKNPDPFKLYAVPLPKK